jgi:hypothetical protein
MRVSSNGNANDARIVYERLCLSCFIFFNVTVTECRNACLREAPPPEALRKADASAKAGAS